MSHPQSTTRDEQLAKIPETIQRADYVRVIESLGLPLDNLLSLTFHSGSIDAELYALGPDGRLYREHDTDEVATHTIAIKVVDE